MTHAARHGIFGLERIPERRSLSRLVPQERSHYDNDQEDHEDDEETQHARMLSLERELLFDRPASGVYIDR